jgi:undecaprenyl diphosphate synthase
LRSAIAATKNNTKMTVVLAVSYSGREEMVGAMRRMARLVQRGELDPARITSEVVDRHLATAGLPDPDLLIRTSGEMRVSNFYLWQIAYSELYVTDTLWPDFREREYLQALAYYQRRQRRFGRTGSQVERLRVAN